MPPFLFNYLSDSRTQNSFASQAVAMASPTERPQSVSITLTPVDDPSDKRVIILSTDKPITIGRSSRSEPKNLAAGLTNALFDNPVVSRKHAQLELNLNGFAAHGKEVTITDLGSMHGTCVNGIKLHTRSAFQLHTGDRIKFGDKVIRTSDVHDGLLVSVDIAGTPTSDSNSHVKPSAGSYKVPSDSDYESDGMDSDYSHDDEPISSTHTTPEQANAKPGSQESPIDIEKPSGGSFREVIDLASDDGLGESMPAPKPRSKPTTIVIQDSYEEPSLRVAESYVDTTRGIFRPWSDRVLEKKGSCLGDMESVMQHNTGLAAILQGDRDIEEEYEDRSDNDEDADEEDSVDGNSMAGIDGFYDDQSDDLYGREDDNLSASDASDLADVGSVSDDEGPEVLSSKRQISPELGTLGQTDDAANFPNVSPAQSKTAPKMHYDPVRASQPPSTAQAATASNNAGNLQSARSRAYASFPSSIPDIVEAATNYNDSSRWDVGPMASQYYSIPNSVAYDYTPGYQQTSLTSQPKTQTTFGYWPAPGQAAFAKFPETLMTPQVDQPKPASKMDIMNVVENRAAKIQERIAPSATKRKADEITKDEPTFNTSIPTLFNEDATMMAVAIDVQPEPQQQQEEATTMEVDRAAAVVEPVPQERPIKKIKRTATSTKTYLPTKEIAKAAGYMALGGAATIGFLVSDMAGRLFS